MPAPTSVNTPRTVPNICTTSRVRCTRSSEALVARGATCGRRSSPSRARPGTPRSSAARPPAKTCSTTPICAVVVERQVDVLARDEVDRDVCRRRGSAPRGRRPVRARPERAGRTTTGTPAAAGSPGSRRSSRATPLRSIRRAAASPSSLSTGSSRAVIRFRNVPAAKPERRPVEVVVRDEPRMLLAAGALERDAVDRRVRRARRGARAGGRTRAAPTSRRGRGNANVYRVVSASYIALIGRNGVSTEEREDVVALEPLAAVQELELDDERQADDLAAELLDELDGRLRGPPRRQDVVVDQRPAGPSTIASACTSSESKPYSSAYFAATVRHGSLPGLRAATKPQPSRQASAPPVM